MRSRHGTHDSINNEAQANDQYEIKNSVAAINEPCLSGNQPVRDIQNREADCENGYKREERLGNRVIPRAGTRHCVVVGRRKTPANKITAVDIVVEFFVADAHDLRASIVKECGDFAWWIEPKDGDRETVLLI
jgi:hypothetical protein